MSDYCDLCTAEIVWAVTPNRKRMPLDPARLAEDDARGNVAVRRDHHGTVLARALSAKEPIRAGEWRAVPHFATCPVYIEQQKRKRAARAGHTHTASAGNVVQLAARRGGARP